MPLHAPSVVSKVKHRLSAYKDRRRSQHRLSTSSITDVPATAGHDEDATPRSHPNQGSKTAAAAAAEKDGSTTASSHHSDSSSPSSPRSSAHFSPRSATPSDTRPSSTTDLTAGSTASQKGGSHGHGAAAKKIDEGTLLRLERPASPDVEAGLADEDEVATPKPKKGSRDSEANAMTPKAWKMGATAVTVTPMRSSVSEPVKSADYNVAVEALRQREYPHMNQGIYLDHGGATIYASSLVRDFSTALLTNLYGNPHSENEPAKQSGEMVDAVREKALRFLGADPEHFDLVFVANATAAIKMVADAFRDLAEKTRTGTFWYGYHKDCHTSLVGVREFANGDFEPFDSDEKVEAWLDNPTSRSVRRANPEGLGLFAYPGQSNMSGRRLPTSWLGRLRRSRVLQNTYSLFDAAALSMTGSLEEVFADPELAPDFTCLSFYKIFGFPDLGALIVRKESGHILNLRRYFGGGTVMFVTAVGRQLSHQVKGLSDRFTMYSIHDGLEDGTLPFHNILALGIAIDTHRALYGERCMQVIGRHTQFLARRLYKGMASLKHGNGLQVCRIVCGDHADGGNAFGDGKRQGPTIAFTVVKPDGAFVEWTEVERLANERGIYIRAGGVCCPGGLATAVGYEQWEWERMGSAGHSCGGPKAVIHHLPTGIVRASLGAMSTIHDVDALVDFLQDTFVLDTVEAPEKTEKVKRDSVMFEEGGAAPVESFRTHRRPLSLRMGSPPVLGF